VAIKCEYREGDTIQSEVNTINRAELAAIKVALEVAPELILLLPEYEAAPTAAADKIEEATSSTMNSTAGCTLNIATDSLTSMYQIWKCITRPQDLRAGTYIGTNLYCRT
jgi:hypothetical protein